MADAYSDLQEENATLKQDNSTLKQQNKQYFSDYTEKKELNEFLKSQVSGSPDLLFESLGLSIDDKKIPVDTNNSIVNINSREYWSREIAIKLLPETESYSKEDGNINVGRVLADKTDLFGLYVNSKNSGVLDNGVVIILMLMLLLIMGIIAISRLFWMENITNLKYQRLYEKVVEIPSQLHLQ